MILKENPVFNKQMKKTICNIHQKNHIKPYFIVIMKFQVNENDSSKQL